MDISACYVYGFKDTLYHNKYLFDPSVLEDLKINVFSKYVYNNTFSEVSYGIEIKPGHVATVEQENKIKDVVTFLKSKYKNTDNLVIGYYVGVVSSDFDGDFEDYE